MYVAVSYHKNICCTSELMFKISKQFLLIINYIKFVRVLARFSQVSIQLYTRTYISVHVLRGILYRTLVRIHVWIINGFDYMFLGEV